MHTNNQISIEQKSSIIPKPQQVPNEIFSNLLNGLDVQARFKGDDYCFARLNAENNTAKIMTKSNIGIEYKKLKTNKEKDEFLRKVVVVDAKNKIVFGSDEAVESILASEGNLTVYDDQGEVEFSFSDYQLYIISKEQMSDLHLKLNLVFSSNKPSLEAASKEKDKYQSFYNRKDFYKSRKFKFPPSIDFKGLVRRVKNIQKFQFRWVIGQFIWDKRYQSERDKNKMMKVAEKLVEQRLLDVVKNSQESNK